MSEWYCSSFLQFCRTVHGIVNSLSDSKRKEKLGGSKRVPDLSSNQLNHVITIIENWKQDEEGLQVSYIKKSLTVFTLAFWTDRSEQTV